MNFNIAKQSLLLALLTLLLIAIIAMMTIGDNVVAPSNIGLFDSYIRDFQNNNPVASRIISSILIILTAFSVGRITVRYNLYVDNSSLAIPIYGLFAFSIVIINDYLIAYIISYMLVLAIKSYFAGYKLTKYGFDPIFRGSLILGLMPYLYPASIVLVLLIPASILLFKRSSREFIVSISGFILPSLLISYISWMVINEPFVHILNIIKSIASGKIIELAEYLPIYTYVVLGCYAMLFLISFYSYIKDRYLSSLKARKIVLFNLHLLVFTIAMLFIPTATTAGFALIAIPVAMFVPIALVHLKIRITLVIYVLLLIFYILKMTFL